MEICYLDVSNLWRKFFSFDCLMLEELPVGLAVVQGELYLITFL